MDLQISVRESGDVTILDLQGRATIGADSDLLSVYLQKLVANGLHVHLHNFKQCDRIDASEALVFRSSDVAHDAKDVIALRQFCRYLGRSLEIARSAVMNFPGKPAGVCLATPITTQPLATKASEAALPMPFEAPVMT